jgi:hypothetical protein
MPHHAEKLRHFESQKTVSEFALVGTSRCDVPARVQRAKRMVLRRSVAPLYAARTAQRAVPTAN